MLCYLNFLPYISTVRLRDMKELVKEVEKLGRGLVFKFMDEGMSNDEAQDAVLVVLKEYMVIGNTTTEDVKECIVNLKMLLKK